MVNSYLANLKTTREVLDSFNLSAKYKFGQNFLVDDNIIGRILDFAHIEDALHPVIEVGPGIGTLSVTLLQKAPVVAIELDKDMRDVLKQTIKDAPNSFALINKDALKVELADFYPALERLSFSRNELPQKLVANLPYQVAATLILDWFERFDFIEDMIVMVQSEVADRISAKMRTKNYGAYSIKLRMYAEVVDRFQVSPSCFYPAPRVESAVVHLKRQPLSDDLEIIATASKIADAAFAQRRKTLRNSLKSTFKTSVVDALLAECGIDPNVRGETLSVHDYLHLGQILLQMS